MNTNSRPPDKYRRIARWYDRATGPLCTNLHQIGMTLWPPQPGQAVLDIGCGTGAQLAAYRDAGCSLFGIDASPSMLARARQRLGARADLKLGDATALPYDDERFELVTISMVLHEMPEENRQPVLREAARVLRPPGKLLITDYHVGPATSGKGWLLRPLHFLIERAAGREHFAGYRSFLRAGGIPPLLERHGLKVVESKIVAGGTLAVFLVVKLRSRR